MNTSIQNADLASHYSRRSCHGIRDIDNEKASELPRTDTVNNSMSETASNSHGSGMVYIAQSSKVAIGMHLQGPRPQPTDLPGEVGINFSGKI